MTSILLHPVSGEHLFAEHKKLVFHRDLVEEGHVYTTWRPPSSCTLGWPLDSASLPVIVHSNATKLLGEVTNAADLPPQLQGIQNVGVYMPLFVGDEGAAMSCNVSQPKVQHSPKICQKQALFTIGINTGGYR